MSTARRPMAEHGVSLLNFAGVDNTGATDCSTAINAALASVAPGTVVFLPPGTYTASVQMTVANVTLRGSWDSIIKTPSGATQGVNDAAIRVFADGVTIDGIGIDGNKTGNPGIDTLIKAAVSDGVGIYASNVTVRNCHVYDAIGHGIIVWGTAYGDGSLAAAGTRKGFLIHGNRIEGGTLRAALDVAFNQGSPGDTVGVLSNNRVSGNTLILHSANDVTVTGNYCYGMSIHSGCERITVVGNVMPGQTLGLLSGQSCVISGNVAHEIDLAAGTGTVRLTDITVSDNVATTLIDVQQVDGLVISGNVTPTINVDDSTDVVISGNKGSVVVGNFTACSDVSVTGNHSPSIALAATGFSACDNLVRDSALTYGMLVNGSQGTVRGNRIIGVTGIGINVGTSTTSEVIVANNDLDTISAEGIYVNSSCTNVRVQDNTFKDVTGADILKGGTGTVLLGNGKCWGRLVVPPASTLAQSAAAAYTAANRAFFTRFSINTPMTLRYFRFLIGTASGNIQVGVVKMTSVTGYTRVMDSGVIACPTAGFQRIDLGAYEALPGDYAAFIWSDNTTFTTPWIASDVARAARLCSLHINIASGVGTTGVLYEDVNHTLLGVALETDL